MKVNSTKEPHKKILTVKGKDTIRKGALVSHERVNQQKGKSLPFFPPVQPPKQCGYAWNHNFFFFQFLNSHQKTIFYTLV